MTKAPSNGNLYKLYLQCWWRFVMFLTSKIITYLNKDFTSWMKSQSITYLLNAVHIYYEFWTLKMECTQYEIYGQAAAKNAN